MHSNSLAKHFFHIFHPISLLPVPDALLLVSNRSQNFYQCTFLLIETKLHQFSKFFLIVICQKLGVPVKPRPSSPGSAILGVFEWFWVLRLRLYNKDNCITGIIKSPVLCMHTASSSLYWRCTKVKFSQQWDLKMDFLVFYPLENLKALYAWNEVGEPS